jgi:hypothetical protein
MEITLAGSIYTLITPHRVDSTDINSFIVANQDFINLLFGCLGRHQNKRHKSFGREVLNLVPAFPRPGCQERGVLLVITFFAVAWFYIQKSPAE